ncbi:MAG: outer membrane beta-barrel family protein [Flavobacteriaceae bacterium]
MARALIFFLFLFGQLSVAQKFSIKGKIVDDKNAPLSFVNILLFEDSAQEPFTGTASEEEGIFAIHDLSEGQYQLEISTIGFKKQLFSLTLNKNIDLSTIVLEPSPEELEEALVTAKRPTVKKTAGMLVFTVENSSLSNGNTLDLLSKTPGVLVLGGKVTIKNRPTTIYINGRRVYLSASETTTFLQNLDASLIKQVEVMTNPSSQFDAESGTVLNIITAKTLTPGYKGTVSGTYEQAIFPKYNMGTAHFFKNNWLHLYGSYNMTPRKENKDQDSYIRFFETDGTTPAALWKSNFNRITKSLGHQGNLVADLDLDPKNSLNVTANFFTSPGEEYNNRQNTSILNAQMQLDSSFVTQSKVTSDMTNVSIGSEYKAKLNKEGELVIGGNFIGYGKDQYQALESNYFLGNGDFLKSIQFETNSHQDTQIWSGYLDLSMSLLQGTFETGVKYSNIDTKTGLDFFDIQNGAAQINTALSDSFDYKEDIYAAYANFSKEFKKWNFNLGTRMEYTDVNGVSGSLGNVNSQNYFKLFPSASLEYTWNLNNGMGLSYVRKIERPRYQSLNPFRYFLNENNFNEGNPNLIPAIEDKISLSYTYKNAWVFEIYYQTIENSLEILNLQDNEYFTFRQLDANLIDFFQFSFDAVYSASINDWWFASYVTSTYYLENEFFAVESPQERYSNHTAGFFAQAYNQFTLSEKGSITADLSARYISNLISGSLDYKNIFDLSFSFRKTFWNKTASVFVGMDDIFNTNNVAVTSRYLNQDNAYFARIETQKFRLGFQYQFGNASLRENKKTISTKEGDRLE